MEEVEDELVRIAALGPADHAPHGGVPAFALVPDDLAQLLARRRAHLDVEAELAPRLGDQLRRLERLRHRPLRVGIQDDLAHRIAGSLPESLAEAGKRQRGGAAEEEGLAS